MKFSPLLTLSIPLAILASGCAVGPDGRMSFEPIVITSQPVFAPPPEPVVEVPDNYIWDGVEYVGFVGDQCYYLGPGGVWLVADPVRFRRFHEWEHVHPGWRDHAVRNDRFRREVAHGKPQKKPEKHQ